MRLQVALDRMSVAHAVELTRQVAAFADWIEVGTSLIKANGMTAVAEVVAAAGTTPVLADTKTADDAVTEVDMCHKAGARATSVLALAPDDTIRACVARAGDLGMETLVDLLATGAGRFDELLAQHSGRPDLVWAAHVGKDQQRHGAANGGLAWITPRSGGHRVAVAGGLDQQQVAALTQLHGDLRVIVGSAITKAVDPAAAAAAFRSLLAAGPQQGPSPREATT
ncbi:orotidine 5'-phosphate decarboxylase / HUMPS family protein [Dactylosporangium sp. NPDC000521]|uniref:orotidine 5'-phosphate decarboxylase / HUMPS family protein n=1 Tax=Dactylosporangium sp. NPDC000521 TaxID=3363975 RepID=UPI0036737E88